MARTLYRQFEGLNHELDTKVFHVNFACFVGEITGGGFAPMVYEMLEMRFRGIILGFRRDPLEGGGQLKKFEEMPELWQRSWHLTYKKETNDQEESAQSSE